MRTRCAEKTYSLVALQDNGNPEPDKTVLHQTLTWHQGKSAPAYGLVLDFPVFQADYGQHLYDGNVDEQLVHNLCSVNRIISLCQP
jgi:hypothetical protein